MSDDLKTKTFVHGTERFLFFSAVVMWGGFFLLFIFGSMPFKDLVLFGGSGGLFILFLKLLFKTGILGTRIFLTPETLVYKRKHISYKEIRHVKIVVKEMELKLARLMIKIIYTENNKEHEVLVPITTNLMFIPISFSKQEEFLQELINRRGKEGVSKEVFDYIETGRVERWSKYIGRKKGERILRALISIPSLIILGYLFGGGFLLILLTLTLGILLIVFSWTVWCSLTREKERKVLVRRLVACLVTAVIFVALLLFQLR